MGVYKGEIKTAVEGCFLRLSMQALQYVKVFRLILEIQIDYI